ncbi:replication initiation protein [Achromobacter xylosoxidans]
MTTRVHRKTSIDSSVQTINDESETSQQLALALFAELAPAGAGVEDAPPSVGFQRNNIFIDIADLSLSARRAIDVAYFIAAEDPEVRSMYETDLHFFKWLMAYGSNNRKHLKHVLREGQKAAIQVEDIEGEDAGRDRWVSVPLLGPVGIANGKVVFEIPRQLQPHIKNPSSSHFLSLRYVFKNLYAKILYDKLLPHLHVEVTPWVSIEELRKWFCLEPDSYTEFKRLCSRIIKPSVQQISQVTDLEVSFSTKNIPGSKKVGHICFRIHALKTLEASKAPMQVLKEMYVVLRDEFGLNGTQLMEIINNREEWTDERIQRAIEYTRFYIAQGKVKLPAGYLMKAIKGDYTLGEAMKTIATQQTTAAEVKSSKEAQTRATTEHIRLAEEDRRKREANIGYQAFASLSPQEQEDILTAFCSSNAAAVLARRMMVEKADLKDMYQDNHEVRELLGAFVALQAKRLSRQASLSEDRGHVTPSEA